MSGVRFQVSGDGRRQDAWQRDKFFLPLAQTQVGERNSVSVARVTPAHSAAGGPAHKGEIKQGFWSVYNRQSTFLSRAKESYQGI